MRTIQKINGATSMSYQEGRALVRKRELTSIQSQAWRATKKEGGKLSNRWATLKRWEWRSGNIPKVGGGDCEIEKYVGINENLPK